MNERLYLFNMDSEKTTPLTQLPQNTETDSDLVNKILNQLDNTNETSPPTFDNVEPSVHPPKAQEYVAPPQIIPQEPMPSPQNIQRMIQSMDVPYIYKVGKMSIFYAIIFLVFVLCTSSFVQLFSHLPLLKATFNNELTNTGKLLQSICFGLLYFVFNIFFSRS